MTSPTPATVSAAYGALIAHSPALADVDPLLVNRIIAAAQAAGLMPERETTLEWAVEFQAKGGKQMLMPDEREALDFIRICTKAGLQDPGRPVHRERTSYTTHIGEWIAAQAEEASA
ncbi:hypothetical protein [Arthrobacter sp. A2-55]|uniref:hypothetical protein n=1 Tax=Arthrobacter sp. A2-55 TaxID=2897337 RepID=UPI0021CDAD58|nr:hypothetical protein [Arthrobacter sp. A2-55]MCU6481957.1 hypothetical protein [Arthrobacter sp. A2-55]